MKVRIKNTVLSEVSTLEEKKMKIQYLLKVKTQQQVLFLALDIKFQISGKAGNKKLQV